MAPAVARSGSTSAPHVAGQDLKPPQWEISGVAAIYNRYEYLDECKAALEALVGRSRR